MIGRILPWLGVVALVVAAVVTAGWGEGTDRSKPPGADRPSASPYTQPTSRSYVDAIGLARNTRLAAADLPAGFRQLFVPRAPVTLGNPSLRLCGAAYPTEHYRLAVGRVAFGSQAGRVTHQVVVYEHGAAAEAVSELASAAPACTRAVPPGPQEQPDTLALRVRGHGRDLVVERRSDVVSLLRVDAGVEADRPGLTLDLARRLGNRLESQLPSP